jgi:hypothetical protein
MVPYGEDAVMVSAIADCGCKFVKQQVIKYNTEAREKLKSSNKKPKWYV